MNFILRFKTTKIIKGIISKANEHKLKANKTI